MGALYKFELKDLIESNNLVNYVETGTGKGECLEYAHKYFFSKYISVEIHDEIYKQAKLKFPNDELYLGDSVDVLSRVLPNLMGNTLFFLDAHFPGADFHYTSYDDCKNHNLRLPLEQELALLCEHRKDFNDILIIDDLRIYMDGPFEGGNWKNRKLMGSNKCGFIFDSLNNLNRSICVDYRDQGYVIGY